MPKVVKKVVAKKPTIMKKEVVVTRSASGGKKVAEKKVTTPRVSGLSVAMYSLAGREAGTLALPKEIFGKEVNKKLLAQAIRVYMTNQRVLPGKTKGRGEVEGSTAKIYNQKGTGRARHGGVRAPIFVGGGITFGPQGRTVRLDMPQKMKKAALFSAMSSKLSEKLVIGLSGLEKATGKTKEISELLGKMKIKSALIVTGEREINAVRGAKNIKGIEVLPANLINAYEVLKHNNLIITKEGAARLANPKVEVSK